MSYTIEKENDQFFVTDAASGEHRGSGYSTRREASKHLRAVLAWDAESALKGSEQIEDEDAKAKKKQANKDAKANLGLDKAEEEDE